MDKVTLKFDNFKSIFEATERGNWSLNYLFPFYSSNREPKIVDIRFSNLVEYCKYWIWRYKYIREEEKRYKLQAELNSLKVFQEDIDSIANKRKEKIQKDLEEVKEFMSAPVPTTFELTLENLEDKYKKEEPSTLPVTAFSPYSNKNIKSGLYYHYDPSTNKVYSYDENLDTYRELIDYLKIEEKAEDTKFTPVKTKEEEKCKSTTYPIIEVLNYMLEYAWDNSDSPNGDTDYLYQATRLLYLEKVLYIMQLVYINRYNKPLFFSEIEVNCNGPIIPDLRHYQITSGLYNYAKEEYRYYYDINNFWNYRVDKIGYTLSEEDKAFIREWWHNDIIESISYLNRVVNSHDIIKQGQAYYSMYKVPKKLTIEAMRQEGKELVAQNGKIHL